MANFGTKTTSPANGITTSAPCIHMTSSACFMSTYCAKGGYCQSEMQIANRYSPPSEPNCPPEGKRWGAQGQYATIPLEHNDSFSSVQCLS